MRLSDKWVAFAGFNNREIVVYRKYASRIVKVQSKPQN